MVLEVLLEVLEVVLEVLLVLEGGWARFRSLKCAESLPKMILEVLEVVLKVLRRSPLDSS